MRVGVYIDAFNLYYGAKSQLGSAKGWKWIDLRSLASTYAKWPNARVERVVYCTARVNDPSDPQQTLRQDFYLKALLESGSVDIIEEGYYSSWAKESVMTSSHPGSRMPATLSDPHGEISWDQALPVRRASSGDLLATVRKREEKGSDVNVATHLVVDVLEARVDAAIVMSNDSDLALPIRIARNHVPVGLINPGKNPVAGALKGSPHSGAGRHWWRPLDTADILNNQLPNPVNGTYRPTSW